VCTPLPQRGCRRARDHNHRQRFGRGGQLRKAPRTGPTGELPSRRGDRPPGGAREGQEGGRIGGGVGQKGRRDLNGRRRVELGIGGANPVGGDTIGKWPLLEARANAEGGERCGRIVPLAFFLILSGHWAHDGMGQDMNRTETANGGVSKRAFRHHTGSGGGVQRVQESGIGDRSVSDSRVNWRKGNRWRKGLGWHAVEG